ncbi:hypothetical protein [Halosimplex halophilum]|uniref:hypothetical protein n=1 Tax=Halosimplex halophilum TaxID=2559572 RepID=UPI00107FBF30|nr:hypothetical protein [Halosimplex halophilum]
MQRRTLLRGLAALAAGAGAGCTANREVPATAPEPPEGIATPEDDGFGDGSGGDGGGAGDDGEGDPTPDRQRFVVPARAFRSDGDGDLLADLTVRNRGEAAHEAVMTLRVEAGDRTFTPSRHVALEPGAAREYTFHFPVAQDQLTGFSVSFEAGPPETPIPEGTVTPYPGDATRTATNGSDTGDDPSDSTTGSAE